MRVPVKAPSRGAFFYATKNHISDVVGKVDHIAHLPQKGYLLYFSTSADMSSVKP